MRKSLPYVVALFAVMTVVPFARAEQMQKPGKWEIRMEMEITGMPMKMPPFTHQVCLTEEDVKDPQKAVPNDPKNPCKISDYKVDGNKVSWKVDCPKQNTKGTGHLTYSENTYSGEMLMTIGEQEAKTKYSGKWLGECKK